VAGEDVTSVADLQRLDQSNHSRHLTFNEPRAVLRIVATEQLERGKQEVIQFGARPEIQGKRGDAVSKIRGARWQALAENPDLSESPIPRKGHHLASAIQAALWQPSEQRDKRIREAGDIRKRATVPNLTVAVLGGTL
jgi:hypothetical protein